ncbi:hypothetical protein [Psychroserpens luteolus]|uniref:hypothetical protein n=1 Tax=Psychroserpens luteolus TaxID=2855840 RepID=UPI001E3BF7DF|nr:hypothetical protein [Psychroserpens luteolus]MCD2259120.1 hypothetical protein [Psychroserpens luteolus]
MGIFDFWKKKRNFELNTEDVPVYKKITVDLQNKTQAEKGTVEKYWFENENIGLKKTLFHRISIPLKPFDSGIEYESQPVETIMSIEWMNLNLPNPDELDGISIKTDKDSEIEASVYIGNAHNSFDIFMLTLNKIDERNYRAIGKIMVDFEHEMVANNETFEFDTTIEFNRTE